MSLTTRRAPLGLNYASGTRAPVAGNNDAGSALSPATKKIRRRRVGVVFGVSAATAYTYVARVYRRRRDSPENDLSRRIESPKTGRVYNYRIRPGWWGEVGRIFDCFATIRGVRVIIVRLGVLKVMTDRTRTRHDGKENDFGPTTFVFFSRSAGVPRLCRKRRVKQRLNRSTSKISWRIHETYDKNRVGVIRRRPRAL